MVEMSVMKLLDSCAQQELGKEWKKKKKSSTSASVCVVNFMEDLENGEAEERFML